MVVSEGLSYANTPRGSRSGGKGNSKEKKLRKQKQEFHTRRQRPGSSAGAALEDVKTRTIIALQHLGSQKLSTEPGGYGLQGWIKSLDLLLDDFQSKLGTQRLSAEFLRLREEFKRKGLAARDTRDIETRIADLRAESDRGVEEKEAARRALLREATDLRERRERVARKLEETTNRLRNSRASTKPRSFFSRFFLKSVPPAEAEDPQVGALRLELEELDSQIKLAEKERDSSGQAAGESPPEDRNPTGADGIGLKELAELESERERLHQLAEEREKVCAVFAELVVRTEVPGETNGGPRSSPE